jgi:predicted 3-demethylubiquinone-9 3-methyltransferase (glyoxalase superfamily)
MPAITPNLWFDDQALEAAELYVSVFPNSRILRVSHYTEAGPGEPGSVLTVDFELDGQRFTAINGGPAVPFDEAVSFVIECKDQAEIDFYWDTLTADGGEESQCGWLKDRFGLSWQVVPAGWEEVVADEDTAKVDRVMRAMFGMRKLDIAALEAAAAGEPVTT